MVSPQALAKIRRIHAEAEEVSGTLGNTPPADRVIIVRRLLLDHCLELRAIIAAGTTEACSIPTIDILRSTQRLLLDFRNLRETERPTTH